MCEKETEQGLLRARVQHGYRRQQRRQRGERQQQRAAVEARPDTTSPSAEQGAREQRREREAM